MMKNIYLCILCLCFMNVLNAQKNNECSGLVSDASCFRYTASGYQEVINGNHSKAINESRKIANILAESELSKMVKTAISGAIEQMISKTDYYYSERIVDTSLVSSCEVFSGMKTICQSKTELINNAYVTHVTKEISIDNIGDVLGFDNEEKKEFKKLLVE